MHTILNAILFRGVFAIKWRAKERFSSNKYGIFHLFSFIRIQQRDILSKKRSCSDECAVFRCAISIIYSYIMYCTTSRTKCFMKCIILYRSTIRMARRGTEFH